MVDLDAVDTDGQTCSRSRFHTRMVDNHTVISRDSVQLQHVSRARIGDEQGSFVKIDQAIEEHRIWEGGNLLGQLLISQIHSPYAGVSLSPCRERIVGRGNGVLAAPEISYSEDCVR